MGYWPNGEGIGQGRPSSGPDKEKLAQTPSLSLAYLSQLLLHFIALSSQEKSRIEANELTSVLIHKQLSKVSSKGRLGCLWDWSCDVLHIMHKLYHEAVILFCKLALG